MDDSEASLQASTSQATPPTLSPLKRNHSLNPNDERTSGEISHASKRLREAMLNEPGEFEEEVADNKHGETLKVMTKTLQDQVTCSICLEILHRPLILLPCLHVFDGSCLKQLRYVINFSFNVECTDTLCL